MLTELCVVLFYDDVIGPRVFKLCVQIIHASYVIVDYNTSSRSKSRKVRYKKVELFNIENLYSND